MPEHKSIDEALLAIQKDLPAIDRDGINPHFKSKFTTLDHLIAKVKPILNKHGVVLVQTPTNIHGRAALQTTLLHEGGGSVTATSPLILPKEDPQGQGSAITYLRRYMLASMLGVADQEDDDANEATEKTQDTLPAEWVDELYAGIKKAEWDFSTVRLNLGAIGADAPNKGTKGEVTKALQALTLDQAQQLKAKYE